MLPKVVRTKVWNVVAPLFDFISFSGATKAAHSNDHLEGFFLKVIVTPLKTFQSYERKKIKEHKSLDKGVLVRLQLLSQRIYR